MTKELIFPAIESIKECLDVMIYVLPQLHVNKHILDDPKYTYLFSVEEVNKLVLTGMSFRDAYQTIAKQIELGIFDPSKQINHKHIGSIAN